MNHLGVFLLAAALSSVAVAGEADIVAVDAERTGGTFAFRVTVRHDDTGWDHYADRWEILSEDGKVLATRTLHHPHVDEQPFTRSLTGVSLPAGTKKVMVRAHDSVDGYGGETLEVNLEDVTGGS